MNLKAKPKLRYIFFDLFATHMEKRGDFAGDVSSKGENSNFHSIFHVNN